MAVDGPVHHHGELTGAKVDAATNVHEPTSVYLTFLNSADEQENVEISHHEAAYLHDWLAKLI